MTDNVINRQPKGSPAEIRLLVSDPGSDFPDSRCDHRPALDTTNGWGVRPPDPDIAGIGERGPINIQ